MSQTTAINKICSRCGSEIAGGISVLDDFGTFHEECWVERPGAVPVQYVTADDVRRIVREELERLKEGGK